VSHHYLAFDSVAFAYPDGSEALRGVSFRITHGESVGIVGANGAGKSTLLLHMNGTLAPSSGTVDIGGLVPGPRTLRDLRKRVGLVFQNPDDQLFCPEVFDDVAFGPINMGLTESEVRKRVAESLVAVGLAGYERRSSHHLSLGEKKRIALASVLSMRPEVLALDEPSSNLDPAAKWGLIQLLKSLDVTKIVVSHDLELIEALCPRLVIMKQGRILADGATKEIMADRGLLVAGGLAAR